MSVEFEPMPLSVPTDTKSDQNPRPSDLVPTGTWIFCVRCHPYSPALLSRSVPCPIECLSWCLLLTQWAQPSAGVQGRRSWALVGQHRWARNGRRRCEQKKGRRWQYMRRHVGSAKWQVGLINVESTNSIKLGPNKNRHQLLPHLQCLQWKMTLRQVSLFNKKNQWHWREKRKNVGEKDLIILYSTILDHKVWGAF